MLQKLEVSLRNKCSLSIGVAGTQHTHISWLHKFQPQVALLGSSSAITTTIRNPFKKKKKKKALAEVREQALRIETTHAPSPPNS